MGRQLEAIGDTRVFEYHNRTLLQCLADHRQIGQQHSGLMLRTPVALPEQDHLRLLFPTYCQQSAEIGIGRNNDSIFVARTLENFGVRRRLKPLIPHMDGIVSILP
jgi:hypothetical protein